MDVQISCQTLTFAWSGFFSDVKAVFKKKRLIFELVCASSKPGVIAGIQEDKVDFRYKLFLFR